MIKIFAEYDLEYDLVEGTMLNGISCDPSDEASKWLITRDRDIKNNEITIYVEYDLDLAEFSKVWLSHYRANNNFRNIKEINLDLNLSLGLFAETNFTRDIKTMIEELKEEYELKKQNTVVDAAYLKLLLEEIKNDERIKMVIEKNGNNSR